MKLDIKSLKVPLEDGTVVEFSGGFNEEEAETLIAAALVQFIRQGLIPMGASPEQVVRSPVDSEGDPIVQ